MQAVDSSETSASIHATKTFEYNTTKY